MVLAEARADLGKKTQDARALGVKYQASKSAEDKTAFDRALKEATDAGLLVQMLSSQEQLASLDELADPVTTTVREKLGNPQAPQGDAANLMPAKWIAGTRQLTLEEHKTRYGGLTPAAHTRAFQRWIRLSASFSDRGSAFRECAGAAATAMGVTAQEAWIHKIVDDSLGGFLVSEDFRAQLIRALPGFTVVRRAGARVINTSKSTVKFPVVNRAASNTKQYSTDLTQGLSNWKQEALTTGGTARTPQSKPTFGMEEIPVHIWQPDPVEITQELLDDSDIDLDGLLIELFAETMGQDTDVAFLRGTGQGTPEGLLNSGASTVTVAGAAKYATPDASAAGGPDNGFQYKRVVDMFVSLAAQYRQNAVWFMNSDTFGRLLSLTGSDGHPLFPINAIPGTLLNRPMFFTEFLDTGATQNNVPILFGDPRYYVIAERRNLGVMRLVERYAPNIALLPTARIGGQLVLPEAFRLGTTGA